MVSIAKVLVCTIVICCCTSVTFAQKADAWTTYMMPSTAHELLKKYEGSFEVEISMWMKPGEGPTVMKLSSVGQMILGGRFLEMKMSGTMMGRPFEGMMIVGYNNSSKELQVNSFTNMGTGMAWLTGPSDLQGKSVDVSGSLHNPVDATSIKVRQRLIFFDDNNLMIENFDAVQGQPEVKTIQYKFTRAKK